MMAVCVYAVVRKEDHNITFFFQLINLRLKGGTEIVHSHFVFYPLGIKKEDTGINN